MVIDTLAAIIILLNSTPVSFDSLQSFLMPRTDTTVYAVVNGDTIWQQVEWTAEQEDSVLREQFGVGINKFQKAIEDIQWHIFSAEEVRNIQDGKRIVNKDEAERIFVTHPDTFVIWTEDHTIEDHSNQYKEYNLYK